MASNIRGRLDRLGPMWIALLVLLLGVAISTLWNGSRTSATTTYTRAWSCMGRDFRPIESSQAWGYWGAALTGTGYFQCSADLPHRATVKRVRFTVHDTATGGWINQCALVRISLKAKNPGLTEVLAGPLGTNVAAGYAPGDVRLTDSSIDFATIDRLNHAYYLQCNLTDNQPSVALWGADVTYTITAANG